MVQYSWDEMDQQACKEAEAMTTMRRQALRTPASRVKRHELRAGLEIIEGRRRFVALFSDN